MHSGMKFSTSDVHNDLVSPRLKTVFQSRKGRGFLRRVLNFSPIYSRTTKLA